jgi:hypothetical protein
MSGNVVAEHVSNGGQLIAGSGALFLILSPLSAQASETLAAVGVARHSCFS